MPGDSTGHWKPENSPACLHFNRHSYWDGNGVTWECLDCGVKGHDPVSGWPNTQINPYIPPLQYFTPTNLSKENLDAIRQIVREEIEAALEKRDIGKKKEGLWDEVRKNSRAALDAWGPNLFVFQYLVRFPVLALDLDGNDLPACVQHAAIILDSSQKRLPDDLTHQLASALGAWEQGAAADAAAHFRKAISLAQESGYF